MLQDLHVTGADVEDAVEAVLVAKMPTVLAQVCAARGLAATLEMPRGWHRMVSADVLARDKEQLPACSIICSEDAYDAPDDEGIVDAVFTTVVVVLCRADDHDQTVELNHLYRQAVRATLCRNRGLGDFGARGLHGFSGRLVPIGDGERSLLAGTVEFDARVAAFNVRSTIATLEDAVVVTDVHPFPT